MRRPSTPGSKEPPQPPGGRALQRAQQFARSRGLPETRIGAPVDVGNEPPTAAAKKAVAKKAVGGKAVAKKAAAKKSVAK
jgi:hypothetical protein